MNEREGRSRDDLARVERREGGVGEAITGAMTAGEGRRRGEERGRLLVTVLQERS